MAIENLQVAAQTVAGFLSNLNKLGGLRLKYRIFGGDGSPEGDDALLNVELSGPDTPLLTQHNGELLRALEVVAAQMLRLEGREQSLVSFDAGNFKALHQEELRLTAQTVAEKVIKTGTPYAFAPTNSRERRLMHMAFRDLAGVETMSHGEGRDRFLAVYPEGRTDLPVKPPMRPRGFGRR